MPLWLVAGEKNQTTSKWEGQRGETELRRRTGWLENGGKWREEDAWQGEYVACWKNKLWNCLDMAGMCITYYTMAYSWRLVNFYGAYSWLKTDCLIFPLVLPSSVTPYLVSFPRCLQISMPSSCLFRSSPLLSFRLRKWFVCRLIQAGRLLSALGKPKHEPLCIKCSTRATIFVKGNHVAGHCYRIWRAWTQTW